MTVNAGDHDGRAGDPVAPLDLRVTRVVAPVRQQVYDQLRHAIVSARFAPGQRLMERELTELTGVSRPTLREALQQLATEGLVTITPGRGWVVTALTTQEVQDLYAVRALLEGLAGRRFAERATDGDIRALHQAFARVQRTLGSGRDTTAMLDAKSKFYEVLFRGTGSKTIVTLISALHARIGVMRGQTLGQPQRPAASAAEIAQIVEAIDSRSPSAAEAACQFHVRKAAETLLASMALNDKEVHSGA